MLMWIVSSLLPLLLVLMLLMPMLRMKVMMSFGSVLVTSLP